MPPSAGNRYCLTVIDRFTRWPTAIPMEDMTAETVAGHLISGWIQYFGVPIRITSDLGRQFESQVFRELNKILGVKHLKTTPYHPQANGIIERWHRTLKTAIKCHQNDDWSNLVPLILLGLRVVYKDDIKASPAELVLGQTLRIPGEYFHPTKGEKNVSEFAKEFQRMMSNIRPTTTAHHDTTKIFVQKELSKCSHVFVRTDSVRTPLQSPYTGPYEVVKRFEKYFVVKVNNNNSKISIDRLKAAFIPSETEDRIIPKLITVPKTSELPSTTTTTGNKATPELPTTKTTRTGRKVKIPARFH